MRNFDLDRIFVHLLAGFIVLASFGLLAYALVTKDEGYFQAVGQVSFGVVGVVVGYYFNHRRATEAETRQQGYSEQANEAMLENESLQAKFVALTDQMDALLAQVEDEE